MGRRSRHSAKTGDQSLYKSRTNEALAKRDDDDSDDDPMYDAVDRHHHRREEEYLKLDGSDEEGDSSEEDDGLTKKREGVFDLGAGGSSDDDNDESDEEEQEEEEERRAKRQREAAAQSALASSDDESSDDSDDEDDEKDRLLNWGDKKQAYYHGDTADLEIGQDVEDAYLEEEAGREVEKARLEDVEEADFLLDDDDDEGAPPAEDEPTKKTSKRKLEEEVETIRSARSVRQLSELSKRQKVQWLEANHPELLPLARHFAGHARELGDETMVAAGALLKNGVVQGSREAEAVGATPAGLRYLLTKSMLQASAALNLALYLLLKADRASSTLEPGTSLLEDEDEADDIRDHPVMARLDQLSRLADGLREGVEDATPGLRGQMASLVKAAALMDGEALSSSDEDEEEDGEEGDDDEDTNSEELHDEEQAANVLADADNGDSNEDASSSSDGEEETEEAAKRRVMTEARFALRAQDVDRDRAERSTKRKRRLAPMASDYGDEMEDVTEEAVAAGRKLASTMNSIVQKSSTSRDKKKNRSVGDEEGEGDEYDDLQRGLKMMEEEFGQDSDAGDSADEEGEEGIGDSDGDDEFYRTVQSKSRAKKAAKQSLYAVRPKYPRLDAEVEGERAIGRTILKNRGLVAHKAKINRNPRVKKREQYRKALIRRKGAVREVRTEEGHAYGGEATGIKSGISRSRKLGSR